MSAAKKTNPTSSSRIPADQQQILRTAKIHAEQLTEKLQKSVLDNPKVAKKAALVISLWINGKKSKR